MKDTIFTEAVKELIESDLEVMDEFIEEEIELLADIGNPEKLIGKKYKDWTPQDLQMLSQIYGASEPNALSELIFRKSYEEVKKLEEEL